jgi:hypothetical protein
MKLYGFSSDHRLIDEERINTVKKFFSSVNIVLL